MRNPTVACIAQMSFVRRGSGKAPGHAARVVLVVLCLFVAAGCGTSTTVVQRALIPTPAATFVPTTVVGSVTSVHMFDATTGWATGIDRLLRTTDGGLHWQDVTPPGSGSQGVAAFPLSADDAWVVRALVDGGSGASRSTVSHTADGGRTWRSPGRPHWCTISRSTRSVSCRPSSRPRWACSECWWWCRRQETWRTR
jgi:hypothetical protein